MDIVDQLGRAIDETGRLVAGVAPDQWELPTPCTEWNVRTLVGHLVRGNQNSAAVALGEPRQPDPIADLGGDPIAAYRQSAQELKHAWADRSLLERAYPGPFGMIPGPVLLQLRLADNITHGWDLARATGQTPRYDEDVVETALTFTRQNLGGERRPGGPFAPPVDVSPDRPAIDRLAAFMGRRV